MKTKRLLIIDDDEGIQTITRFSLEMETNWKIMTAFLAKEGLAKAKAHQPDAILLDIMMPDLNGLDILRQLQADSATKSIPVILFTAKALKEEILQLQQTGVVAVLTKPFDCLTLASQIAEVLDW